MKKIIASAGLFAAGVAGLHAENLGDLSPEMASKRWHLSAALRGFYDDNYASQGSGLKEGSGGLEFAPEASVNFPMAQTFLSATYRGSLLYYFDRPGNEIDHSHTLDLKADHRFTERHRLNIQETFVYSQQPAIVDRGGVVTAPTVLRDNIETIRNLLPIEFTWDLSRLFILSLGYQNTYYNYLDNGNGSYSAKLDRFEHLFRADGGYQLTPKSTVLLGYTLGLVNYTSDDQLTIDPNSLDPSARDTLAHYLYAGYDHQFANNISLSARAGGQYTDYESADSDVSPYADISVTYRYLSDNSLRLGLKQSHNSTDQTGAAISEESLVLDQDTTTIYGTVTHRLTPKLTATGTAQYQHSIYNGGYLDDTADDYIQLGLVLAYKFTRNWSAELEYDFYKLVSDSVDGLDFSRNVIYGGVRFTF